MRHEARQVPSWLIFDVRQKTMHRYLSIILFACCCSAAEPVLVVLERNPWLMVIGSDSPTFALYDDGSVIWLRDKPTKDEPFSRGTTASASAALKEVIPYDLAKLADHYELTSWTDQPTTVIWTSKKRISIYGRWRDTPRPAAESNPQLKEIAERDKKMWDSLPSELRATLLRIDDQRKQEGAAWLPDRVEVMLWPYEYAPEESIVWPKTWSGLAATSTVRRGSDSYSVFLPAVELAALRDFLAKRRQRGAVLIDGKKMSASFRFPFPREELWMNH